MRGLGLRNFKIGFMLTLVILCCSCTALAVEKDTWQHEIGIYGWFAGVDGDAKLPNGPGSGVDFTVDTSDIIENLNMIFMGNIESKYNKWSLLFDVVYMDVGGDANKALEVGPGVPVNGSVGMDLSSWVLNGAVGYDVLHSDNVSLSVIGGVRYMTVDVDVRTSVQGPLSVGHSHTVSETEGVLDGVVGIRGRFILNENWYIPYHADIGGGGSDLTWQLFAGVGYQFSWGDIRFGYRHLQYELDDDNIMQEMILSGPVLGIGFKF